MLVELPFNKFIEMIIEKKSIDFCLKIEKDKSTDRFVEENSIRSLMFKTHTTGNGLRMMLYYTKARGGRM